MKSDFFFNLKKTLFCSPQKKKPKTNAPLIFVTLKFSLLDFRGDHGTGGSMHVGMYEQKLV